MSRPPNSNPYYVVEYEHHRPADGQCWWITTAPVCANLSLSLIHI